MSQARWKGWIHYRPSSGVKITSTSGLPWPLQVGETILLFRHLILAGLNKWLASLHNWRSNWDSSRKQIICPTLVLCQDESDFGIAPFSPSPRYREPTQLAQYTFKFTEWEFGDISPPWWYHALRTAPLSPLLAPFMSCMAVQSSCVVFYNLVSSQNWLHSSFPLEST